MEKIEYEDIIQPRRYIYTGPIVSMPFGRFGRAYGVVTPIPLSGCRGMAITQNGIIYDYRNQGIVTPTIVFGNDGAPRSAKIFFKGHKEAIDLVDLILIARYRLNPENFNIDYTLRTDGNAYFVRSMTIKFKDPVKIEIPKSYQFKVIKILNEYFINREGEDVYVSSTGGLFNLKKKEFLKTYVRKIFSEADGCEVFQSIMYQSYKPTPLIKYVVENWSGSHIPEGYSVVNNTDIPTLADLDHFDVNDFRLRNLKSPERANREMIEERFAKKCKLRERINREIARTKEIIRKHDPDIITRG